MKEEVTEKERVEEREMENRGGYGDGGGWRDDNRKGGKAKDSQTYSQC